VLCWEISGGVWGLEWQQGWRNLGFVAGAGTTSQARRYAFEVGRRAPGLFRYRLRQWDVDGRYTYSPTIEVQVTTPDVWVEGPYPNPLRRESKVRVALPYTQDVKLILYSVLGQPVKVIGHRRLEAQEMHTFSIDVQSLASCSAYSSLRGMGAYSAHSPEV